MKDINFHPEAQHAFTAEENGYTDGLPQKLGEHSQALDKSDSNLREIALAVAVQTATSSNPGEDVVGTIIGEAKRYLGFLKGEA